MIGLITWIILGGLAGWIASKFMHTDKAQGLGLNILIGMVGAVIGGLLMQLIGGAGITGFNLYSLIVAVIGSVILLAILRHFGKEPK